MSLLQTQQDCRAAVYLWLQMSDSTSVVGKIVCFSSSSVLEVQGLSFQWKLKLCQVETMKGGTEEGSWDCWQKSNLKWSYLESNLDKEGSEERNISRD